MKERESSMHQFSKHVHLLCAIASAHKVGALWLQVRRRSAGTGDGAGRKSPSKPDCYTLRTRNSKEPAHFRKANGSLEAWIKAGFSDLHVLLSR